MTPVNLETLAHATRKQLSPTWILVILTGLNLFNYLDRQALGPLRRWLESTWDDALYRLKLAAELEAGRRGPTPTPVPRTRKRP